MDRKNLKKFFIELTDIVHSERIFIVGALVLMALLQGLNYYVSKNTKVSPFEVLEAPKSDYYYTKSASSDEESSPSTNRVSYHQTFAPFDPNTVDENQLLSLGFSPKVCKIFLNYRNKGGHFYKKEDVHKVFGVSDRLYASIEPYIEIASSNNSFQKSAKTPQTPSIIDINRADVAAWQALPKIGKYYAEKLIQFRTSLGGFVSIEQIKDCYGIQDSVFQAIKPFLTIIPAPIKKINVNEATLEELDAHPYIAKWQAADIVKNRPIHGFNDLMELYTFEKNKAQHQRLIPYLTF